MEKSVAQRKLERAITERDSVKASYERALQAQSWQTANGNDRRQVSNANIAHLFTQLQYWENEVDKLEAIVNGRSGGAFRIGVTL